MSAQLDQDQQRALAMLASKVWDAIERRLTADLDLRMTPEKRAYYRSTVEASLESAWVDGGK